MASLSGLTSTSWRFSKKLRSEARAMASACSASGHMTVMSTVVLSSGTETKIAFSNWVRSSARLACSDC